jgi:hypothetical protein
VGSTAPQLGRPRVRAPTAHRPLSVPVATAEEEPGSEEDPRCGLLRNSKEHTAVSVPASDVSEKLLLEEPGSDVSLAMRRPDPALPLFPAPTVTLTNLLPLV